MNYKLLGLIAILYIVKVMLFSPHVLSYSFDGNLVKDYLRSQDIEDPEGRIKDRIFISDSDIYTASGYLYATGSSPAKYNFQHPPFAKYLYGASILFFNNPYYFQIISGIALLFFTYLVATEYFSSGVGILAAGLLLIDPVMTELTQNILLDLPLAALLMIYVYLKKRRPKTLILPGIILGLMAATKFASTAVIVFGIVVFSEYLKDRKLLIKDYLVEIFSACIVYLIVYTGFFLQENNIVNFVMLQIKMAGFMLRHNTSQYLGNSLVMFLTGFYKDWWNGEWMRITVWSAFWPVSLIASVILAVRSKKITTSVILLFPTVLLLSTVRQFAFSRYFITIVPFLYMLLAYQVIQLLKKYETRKS